MSVQLASLVDGPLGADIVVLTDTATDRALMGVQLIERAEDIDADVAGQLALLPPRASSAITTASGYRLDVLLRQAAAHDAVAILIAHEPSDRVSPTALAVARRYGITLLGYPPSMSFAQLLIAIHAEIEGGAERALQQLAGVADDLPAIIDSVAAPSEVVTFIASRMGLPLDADEVSLERGSTGQPLSFGRGAAARIAMRLATNAVRLAELAVDTRDQTPIRSRAAVLGELLLSARTPSEELLARARSLGLSTDAWQTVVVVDPGDAQTVGGGDAVRAFELLEQIDAVALGAARAHDNSWSSATVNSRVFLVRSQRHRPPQTADATLRRAADAVLDQVRQRFPEIDCRVGVGLHHEGPQGLRRSAAEARAAAATARVQADGEGVRFADQLGLRRILLDMWTSDDSRALVDELLKPLDELGGERADRAIETLGVYLACNRSLVETARILNLHRNSVVYRIQRITEQLDQDLDDTESRFALELACRVRALTGASSA